MLLHMKYLLTLFFLASLISTMAQSLSVEEYAAMKARKIAEKSPFEKIADRELPATIVYENDYVIAFKPLKNQAPVHYLIVPKKRINTINEVTETDVLTLGHLFLAAKVVAEKMGVAETGYRLAVNTNRDAGQSEFHVHMHLLGGEFVGPMVNNAN